MKFTVLGGHGFIGRHLVASLRQEGHTCYVPDRSLQGIFASPLGHVVDCIGLTADYRARPFETMEAHACLLVRLLREAKFKSFLYLSSARVYLHSAEGREDTALSVDPNDPADIYNISKLAGESLCLAQNFPEIRVVRLTNVFGYDPQSKNFLSSVIDEALSQGVIRLEAHPESAKDYVAVDDVVRMLPLIAKTGQHRLYNLGGGESTSHGAVTEAIAQKARCSVEVSAKAQKVVYPPISIDRLRHEFHYHPQRLLDCIEDLVTAYMEASSA